MKKSSLKKYSQVQLTKLLAQDSNWQGGAWSHLRQTIWFNPTDDNSLRLSHAGFAFFKSLGYKGYEFTLESTFLANRHLLILERYYPGVYMLVNAKKIILFDDEYANLIILMGGDFTRYLDNLEQNSIDIK